MLRVAPLATPAIVRDRTLSCAPATEAVARPHLPSSRPCSDATSSAYFSLGRRCRLARSSPLAAAAATEQATADATAPLPSAAANVEAALGNGAFLLAEEHEWAPEAFTLEPGELGPVDRYAETGEPAEAFRCRGCTRPECQVGKLCRSALNVGRADDNPSAVEHSSQLCTGCFRDPQAAQPSIGARRQLLPMTICGRS